MQQDIQKLAVVHQPKRNTPNVIAIEGKGLPQQTEVVQGVPGRLTLWRRNFLLNFSTLSI